MLDGELSELGLSVRPIKETECGSWHTPQACHGQGGVANSGDVQKIRTQVDAGAISYRESLTMTRGTIHHKCLPDWRTGQLNKHIEQNGRRFSGQGHGGQLDPTFAEYLMGWPIGWTDLKPLETDKFRNVQPWHSTFSQKD
jgi:hypothetical protein